MSATAPWVPPRTTRARAHRALVAAGHRPSVLRTYGCYGTDRFFSGRRKIKELTGNYKVPTLILDDGEIIDGSANIVAWASAGEPCGEAS